MMRRLRPHPSPPSSRRGLTLIELLVVISICSVIMLLFGTILFRVYRHQTLLTVATHQSSTWLRLARTLRSDLHSASQVSLGGDQNSQLTLVSGSESVSWTIDGPEVRRILKTSNPSREAVNAEREDAAGIERFVLSNSELKFELSGPEPQQLVRLVATAKPLVDSSLPPASGSIESAIGINRRWEGGQP